MTQFDTLVQEQLLLLDESWKDSAKKYATGAAIGAAGLLGLQHGLKDKHHNYDLTRTKMTQQQSVGSFSPSSPSKSTPSKSTPSKANSEHTIKAKHNINEYKYGLMAKFHNTEITAGNAKPSESGTYSYTIVKEKGQVDGMPTGYQLVRIYDIYDNPIVTIRFSKDGSEINGIFKRKANLQYPEKMKGYIKSQFGIDL
jgi:hypothetical protein